MSAALAANSGSLLSHQDLRAARSILWARRKRQTYCTSTSPSALAISGCRPARMACRRPLLELPQNAPVGRLRVIGDRAPVPRLVETRKPLLGVANPPLRRRSRRAAD